MAIPTTRSEFKEHCLRALGKPVLEINVDDTQVEDRIDEALSYYYDYHFDGSSHTYYKILVDQALIDNQYVDLPENIMGVVRLFNPQNTLLSSNDIFNVRYRLAMDELYTLNNLNIVGYYMTMTNLGVMQELLVGSTPIRFNRHRNRLHIDGDMSKYTVGSYLLVEAYEVVDPTLWSDVWKDRWLQRYCAQLIKKNWGSNLIKFEGLQLPGGVQFNGNKIYDDAVEEIRRLEEEMITNFSLPVMDMIG